MKLRGSSVRLVAASATIAGLAIVGVGVSPSASAAGTCPGQTSTAPPSNSTYFSYPTEANGHDQVIQAMINLICNVTPYTEGNAAGSTSHVNVVIAKLSTNFSSVGDGSVVGTVTPIDNVILALKWVHDNENATFSVVLDGRAASDPAVTVLNNDAVAAGTPPSRVVPCGSSGYSSCLGNNIMHNKFIAIDQTGSGAVPAVLISSQNLTANNENNGYNNGVEIVGNATLETAYATYASIGLTYDKPVPDWGDAYKPVVSPSTGFSSISASFFPRNDPTYTTNVTNGFPTDPTADTVAQDKNVDPVSALLLGAASSSQCLNPGPDAGAYNATAKQAVTTITIGMYEFKNRPAILADIQLLVAAHCQVNILYTDMDQTTFNTLRPLSSSGYLSMTQIYHVISSGTCTFLHSKYFLISGQDDGLANVDVTTTGSENWLANSLHDNDENMVSLVEQPNQRGSSTTSPIYNSYLLNWEYLATNSNPDGTTSAYDPRHPITTTSAYTPYPCSSDD